jgi:murein DD-endopeptidase
MSAPDFIRPTKISKVSSSFDDHKERTPPSGNPGTDYPCPVGMNAVAVADGKVVAIKTNTSGGAGRFVVLDHGRGWSTEYFHLSRVLVRVGQKVKQGKHIAETGASGFGREYGYAPHLHLILRFRGRMLSNVGNRDFERALRLQKKADKVEASKPVEGLGS